MRLTALIFFCKHKYNVIHWEHTRQPMLSSLRPSSGGKGRKEQEKAGKIKAEKEAEGEGGGEANDDAF